MLQVDLTIPFWLELAAALTGGLSGAMSAVRARYDIFGVVCIALTAGLAGGIMRDLLLQNYGIYAFQNPQLLLACAAAGVAVFYFGKLAAYLDPIIALLDNLSVALWAVISVGKSLSAGLDVVPAVILGTVTAVGGGILRDVFMNREPEAFQAGTLYGSAALLGSIVYALMKQNHILDQYAAIACVAIVLLLRYTSLFFGWRTSEPRDYTDVVTSAVVRPVKSVARRVRPPEGKVRRDRVRKSRGYERLRRIWRAPGSTSPLPPLEQHVEADISEHVEHTSPTATTESEHAETATRSVAPGDPSDRILVSRDELHRIMGGEFDDEPRDPFEPRS